MAEKSEKEIDLKVLQQENEINDSTDLIKLIGNTEIENNLTKVLKTVHNIDIVCDFKKCRQKTNLVGHDCKLCKKRYCIAHTLPEIHGCGEAVRHVEQELFRHPPQPSLSERNHGLVKDKLANKLKEMDLSRKPKSKSTQKKKKK